MLTNVDRFMRFIVSLIPALILLFGIFYLIDRATETMPGARGIILALSGAVCLGLGLMLGRALIPTVRHLRILNQHCVDKPQPEHDGKTIAFSGNITVKGQPLTAPFCDQPCAAYTYRVSRTVSHRDADGSSSSRQAGVAEGMHFLESQIQGDELALSLMSLPQSEDELRENYQGRDKPDALRALLVRIREAPSARQDERHGHLLALKHSIVRSTKVDYMMLKSIPVNIDSMTIEETWLPVDEPMCMIGSYNAMRQGLSAGRGLLGGKLTAYRGTPDSVRQRIHKDNRSFGITFIVLMLLGIVLLGIPLALGQG